MLMRLLLRGVRITALMGRGAVPVGEAGGEAVIALVETTLRGGEDCKNYPSVGFAIMRRDTRSRCGLKCGGRNC